MKSPFVARRYEAQEMDCKGKYGAVFRAINYRTGRTVALKVLVSDGDVYNFLSNVDALKRLVHPNVVAFHNGFALDVYERNCVLQSVKLGFDPMAVLIMEYCEDGHLQQWLRKREFASPIFLLNVFRQMLLGLNFLYDKGFQYHGDIKDTNIIFQGDCPKLCDFGLNNQWSVPVIGHSKYAAPEIRSYSGAPYIQSCDVFSMGVILVQLFTLESFFRSWLHVRRPFPFPVTRWPYVALPAAHSMSDGIANLVGNILSVSREKRINAYDLLGMVNYLLSAYWPRF